MLNSRAFDYRVGLTLVVSVFLGLLLLKITPLLLGRPILLLALPVAAAFLVLLVLKPKWIMLLLVLSRPLLDNLLNLSRTDVGGQNMGIGAFLNLAIIGLVIFMIFYYGDFPRKDSTVLCWILFLVCMLIASLYSPFFGRAIRLFFNYLSYFAMFLLPFLVIKKKEDFEFWAKVLLGSFVLPVLFANLDFVRGGTFYPDAGMRIRGTFTHPNVLAFYLVLGLTFCFHLLKGGYLRLGPRVKIAVGVLMLNMAVLLILTKTRNAWIACFAGFFIYGLFKDRRLLLVMLLLIPLATLTPQVQERARTMFKGGEANNYKGVNSWEWRVDVWKSSLPKIAERPLHGHGLTSFASTSGTFTSFGGNVGAHNAYIELLYETGIIGFLSFLGVLLSPLIRFFKNMLAAGSSVQSQLAAILVGYMISYLLICAADNLTYYLTLNWYVWFFVGLMLLKERFRYA